MIREQSACPDGGVVWTGIVQKRLSANGGIILGVCIAKERLEAGGGVIRSRVRNEGLIADSGVLETRADHPETSNVCTPQLASHRVHQHRLIRRCRSHCRDARHEYCIVNCRVTDPNCV